MKKICVIGHANNISVNKKNTKWAETIANWTVKNNYIATTGGCIGIPELFANKVIEKGGKVLAYSPAYDVKEHITAYGFAENKNTEIRYLQPTDSTENARFLIRSIDLVEEADLVFCFKGTWGTLSEIVFAVMCSKQIIFLNIDGDNKVLKQIYDLMDSINLREWNEKVVEVKTEKELKKVLEKFEKENQI